MPASRLLEKKKKALDRFSRHLLSSPGGKSVGKIILFGSLTRGEAKTESDVDVLILALDNLRDVENAAADAAFEIGLEIGEIIGIHGLKASS